MRFLFSGLLASFATASIVLPPSAGKTGADKVFVLIHGAFVNESNYKEIAGVIQAASPLRLWVGLPSFAFDSPNPLQVKSAVKSSIKDVEKAGGFSASSSDVFVAGHSLGGVFAPSVVASENYAALIEFGSYVTQGNDITTMKQPVLTLGGELDGLTRVSRIAVEYQKMAKLPADEQWRKPVIVIPGVCHSQFCSNVNVTSFGMHDLVPEVSWSDAHQTIAEVTAQFLNLVTNHNVQAAKAALTPRLQYTNSLVAGFLAMHALEESASVTGASTNWCAQMQKGVVAPDNATGGVQFGIAVKIASQTSIPFDGPQVDRVPGGTVSVSDVSYAAYGLNPIDISTVPVAATSITCEMMSADAIDVAAKKAGAGGKAITPDLCQAANNAAIELAEASVSKKTLVRFSIRGQALKTLADAKTTTGPTFLAESLTFDHSVTPVQVQGVSLATKTTALVFGGVYECHLLSPAKVAEWMMVDGLPKLG